MGYDFSHHWLQQQSGRGILNSLSSIPRLRPENNSTSGVISRDRNQISALAAECVSTLTEIPAKSHILQALRDLGEIPVGKQYQYVITFADVGVFTPDAVVEMISVAVTRQFAEGLTRLSSWVESVVINDDRELADEMRTHFDKDRIYSTFFSPFHFFLASEVDIWSVCSLCGDEKLTLVAVKAVLSLFERSYGQGGRVIFEAYEDLKAPTGPLEERIKTGCCETLYLMIRLRDCWLVSVLDLSNFRVRIGDAHGRSEHGKELDFVIDLAKRCKSGTAEQWDERWNDAQGRSEFLSIAAQALDASDDVLTLISIEMQVNKYFNWAQHSKYMSSEYHRVRFLGLLTNYRKFCHDTIVMAHRAYVPDDENAPTASTEMAEYLSSLSQSQVLDNKVLSGLKERQAPNDGVERQTNKRRRTAKRCSMSLIEGHQANPRLTIVEGSKTLNASKVEATLNALTGDQLQLWKFPEVDENLKISRVIESAGEADVVAVGDLGARVVMPSQAVVREGLKLLSRGRAVHAVLPSFGVVSRSVLEIWNVMLHAKLLANNIRHMLDWLEEEGDDDESISALCITISSEPRIVERRIQLSSGNTRFLRRYGTLHH
ncbi:unnamed protein product [Mortierella alpina]